MKSQETSTNTPGHNGGALEQAFDRASARKQRNTDSTSSSGKPVVDRMTAGAHEAVDKVSSVASHAIDTLGVKGEQINAAEQRLVAGTRKYVQENPVTSVGIAVAAGYVLSRIFSSR